MPSFLRALVSFVWPLILGTGLGLAVLWVYTNQPVVLKKTFLSPIGSGPQVLAARADSDKPLIGFLPYWMVGQTEIPYQLLDQLAYFAVALKADGTVKKTETNHAEIGWHKLNSDTVTELFREARAQEVKIVLVITAFDNDLIDTLIREEEAKAQAIKTITALATEYGADSINLDFEYNLGKPIQSGSGELYADFVKEVRQALKAQNPETTVSVDLFANAFIRDVPYDVEALGEAADWLVLMGYDFYQTSSAKAGPVAPLKSQSGASISLALKAAFEKKVPTDKIILAMPLYGYEWQTTTEEYGAPTYPESGVMASYKRVSQLIEDELLESQWDHLAMSPWLVYTKDNKTQQIYFENDQSIGLKLQLIDQAQLGGGAFWALGYEGSDAAIWNTVEAWRKQNTEARD